MSGEASSGRVARLAGLSVRRGVTFVMLYLIVVGFGLFSLLRLKMDMFPDISFPAIFISSNYTGASPEDIETLIVRPIEEAVASVNGVEDVDSDSRHGVGVVTMRFAWGTDMQEAEREVRKNIDMFWVNRPDDATDPVIFAFDPSLQPIMILTLEGDVSQSELRRLSEDVVEPRLERLDGIASALTAGGLERQIQVRVHPKRLEAFGIPVSQVVAAIRGENAQIPGGVVDDGSLEVSVTTVGQFDNVEQIEDVIVGRRGTTVVRLGDVADVRDWFKDERRIVRSNGAEGVMVLVRKQSDANTVQAAKTLQKELPEVMKRLPAGVTVSVLFDQSDQVLLSLGNLSDTAVQAFFLAALVLLLFLASARAAIIVAVSIPVSLVVTFAVMDTADVTLNIISMAGLALGVGMLVDNSIVVLEAIYQHMERGESPRQAAIRGASEVTLAITASTLTTVAVFAPILFVPGIAGQMFRDMALTICFSLLASLVTALTLIPLLASRLLRYRPGLERPAGIIGWAAFPLSALFYGLNRVLRPLADSLSALSRVYGRAAGWAVRHRWITFGVATLLMVGTFALGRGIQSDFMPKGEGGMIMMDVKAAAGTALATTDRQFKEVERIVRESVPEATIVNADFGYSDGFSASILGQSASSGVMRVKLPRLAERTRTQQAIERGLRPRLLEAVGLDAKVRQAFMFGSDGDIRINLYAHELEEARGYAERVKDAVSKVEGAADVFSSIDQSRPEYDVLLRRERIRQLGLTPAQVAATISTLFQGTTASRFRDGADEYDIVVRAPRAERVALNQLERVPISTPVGGQVPLSEVAEVRSTIGPVSIGRQNQKRLASVYVTADNVPLGVLTERVQKVMDAVPKPADATWEIRGSAEDMQESFQWLVVAFAVAVLLVYMVMASQFESLLEPFVIIFSVPLAAVGVVLGLRLSGTPLQVTALIGVVMLVGIVVNNAIVLIDRIKQLREEGQELILATQNAARERLRPILSTTLTTVLALVPLSLGGTEGSETWGPMAVTVMGGLSTSTLLTLFFVPTLYVWFIQMRERAAARRAKVRARAGKLGPSPAPSVPQA